MAVIVYKADIAKSLVKHAALPLKKLVPAVVNEILEMKEASAVAKCKWNQKCDVNGEEFIIYVMKGKRKYVIGGKYFAEGCDVADKIGWLFYNACFDVK